MGFVPSSFSAKTGTTIKPLIFVDCCRFLLTFLMDESWLVTTFCRRQLGTCILVCQIGNKSLEISAHDEDSKCGWHLGRLRR